MTAHTSVSRLAESLNRVAFSTGRVAFPILGIALLAVGGSAQSQQLARCTLGPADDAPALQAALDAAEASGRPLDLPAGRTLTIRSTLYLGNVTLRGNGARIRVLLDGCFGPRGPAAMAKEGAILTRSANGVGAAPVRIAFDSLTVDTERTSDSAGPKTGLLLENVAAFTGQALRVSARGTGRSEVNPFDLYRGVQGVRLGTLAVRMANPGAHGGVWIRNFSPTRATADVTIGLIDAAGATGDELVSIFNSGSPDADLHDIRIGRFVARPGGGAGMALSIFRNAGDWDPARMQRIRVDRIDVTEGGIGPLADSTGGYAVKVQKVAPTIGAVRIAYQGAWMAGLPYVFGLRFVPGKGQREPLYIPSIAFRVDARNRVPPKSAAMLYGPISTDRLVVRGAGSGFRQVVYGGAVLRGVDVRSTAFSDKLRYEPPADAWGI